MTESVLLAAANRVAHPQHRSRRGYAFRAAIAVLVLLNLSQHVAAQQTRSSSGPPNILMIVADDLGYSDLGCYGGEIRTPNIDSLAAKGVRLTRFYNLGRCCPSRTSILTGQYPHRVGVGHKVADLGRPGYRGRISAEARTVAQVLAPHGYRSFISGKWHLGTPDPTTHGFEEFYGTLPSAQTFWDPNHMLRLPKGRRPRTYEPGEFYATDAVADHALDFLRSARSTPARPWFLYVAFHAPHFPLQAPPEEIARYTQTYQQGWDQLRQSRLQRMKKIGLVAPDTQLPPRSRYWNYGELKSGQNPAWESLTAERQADLARRMAIYAAMIDRVDQNVGRLLADVQRHDEFDRTLTIFLSDNGACAEWDPYGFDIKSSNQNILHRGEELDHMGGRGTYHSVGSAWANASNTPWRLQKHYVHEGGISSPCVVRWPSQALPAGAIVDTPAHVIDLMPTLLAAAEGDYEGPLPLPGVNLLPMLQGEGDASLRDRPLFYEHEGNRAVHAGNWKLVALRDEPWELYDLSVDRTEMNNLAAEHSDRVDRLSAAWEQWATAAQVTPLPEDYEVDYLRPPSRTTK